MKPTSQPDDGNLPKSPVPSPAKDMDSYSCGGDRMLQMSTHTYSQSSSSQSPSSLPSSRSMVSPQPLTPSSTDSHMSRDKSPSPHREKVDPDGSFRNTSTGSESETKLPEKEPQNVQETDNIKKEDECKEESKNEDCRSPEKEQPKESEPVSNNFFW